MKQVDFCGFEIHIADSGKLRVHRTTMDFSSNGDYGADPVGDGTFRMVPSGDTVSFEERNRRLKK